ncbi:MAG: JAB domain-containing protein [Clostridia bacterium]
MTKYAFPGYDIVNVTRKGIFLMPDIPHTGHRERIRSRYAETGGDGFLDYQLLELLLTYSIPRRDTNELAHALLDRFGSLSGVLGAEVRQLMLVEGIGESTAIFLHLHGTLQERLALEKLNNARGRVALTTPLYAAQFARAKMRGFGYETVLATCLNSRREVLHTEILQRGSLTEAQVYPRAIAEIALLRRAHAVLLIHNHPSGNPSPSSEDADVTVGVRAALGSIGAQLMDHLIVGDPFVYSFSADVVLNLSDGALSAMRIDDFQASRANPPQPILKKVMEQY